MYHVQTEDSGKISMSVTTLLYSAGTIISSKKTSYRELVEREDFNKDALQELMKAQHKAMLIELKNGVFDDPFQAKLSEPEELQKEEDRTIIDAIKAIEGAKLDLIIADAEKKKTQAQVQPPVKKQEEKTTPPKKQTVQIVKSASPKPEEPFILKELEKKEKQTVREDSERSLDEVILNYLSSTMKSKEKNKG